MLRPSVVRHSNYFGISPTEGMIIFVYNADSGMLNAVFDFAHKILSPSTYNCRLCQLTYGTFSEKQVWKEFRDNTAEELLFLHRDEYERQFEKRIEYPVILKNAGNDLEVLLPHHEIEKMSDVADLIDRMKEELNVRSADS